METLKEAQQRRDRIAQDTYVKDRDYVITEILNVTKTVWPNDNEMLDNAVMLTTALQVAKPDQRFVDDIRGFMFWCGMKGEISSRALSTILHDLGEFMNNRDKSWFAPRTAGYSKYLTGASNVR